MLIGELRKLVFVQLFEQIPSITDDLSNVIRKQTRNLGKNGDISFSLLCEGWINKTLQEVFNVDKEKFLRKCIYLKEKSLEWPMPIEKICFNNERCTLHLNRVIAMKCVFSEMLKNSYGKIHMKHNFRVVFSDSVIKDITSWRSNEIALVIQNVINFCKIKELKFDKNYLDLHFLVNGSKTECNNANILVYCGIVIDRTTKKKSNITFDEYFCSRRTDMQLIAIHKYGIRIKESHYFKQLLDKLGRAAVIIDLVDVKHTSPVQTVKDNNGCSKGAAFILYNCARIETILESFNEKVKQEFYPELPHLLDVDLSSLIEEEEWELVYNYLVIFPDMLVRVLQDLEYGKCAPYLLPKFLNGLASVFSVYYKRVKILLDNRKHLISAIFARIYLLKSVHKIFKLSLKFLDIKSIKKM